MIKGIHHVSMNATMEEYERAVRFYTEILGLPAERVFDAGCLIAAGSGYIELFHTGEALPKGTIRHFALEVDSAEYYAELCRNSGYSVITEPKDVVLDGLEARVTFILGPLGEEIEFFEVK